MKKTIVLVVALLLAVSVSAWSRGGGFGGGRSGGFSSGRSYSSGSSFGGSRAMRSPAPIYRSSPSHSARPYVGGTTVVHEHNHYGGGYGYGGGNGFFSGYLMGTLLNQPRAVAVDGGVGQGPTVIVRETSFWSAVAAWIILLSIIAGVFWFMCWMFSREEKNYV